MARSIRVEFPGAFYHVMARQSAQSKQHSERGCVKICTLTPNVTRGGHRAVDKSHVPHSSANFRRRDLSKRRALPSQAGPTNRTKVGQK